MIKEQIFEALFFSVFIACTYFFMTHTLRDRSQDKDHEERARKYLETFKT